MATRQREIDALRARILKLEAQQEQQEKEKQALIDTRQAIQDILENAGITFEAFIRHNAKTVRRIVAKIEREEAKSVQPESRTSKKKATKKRRRKAVRAKTIIKIPAGNYTNIPGTEGTVFEVKEKGPRPKALKAYAEELGLEKFFEQCRMD